MSGSLMALLAAVSNPSAQGGAPGGVAGAALWVKADAGLVLNGATQQVNQWNDQSGSGLVTTELRAATPAQTNAIAPSNDILRVGNGINFNPAVDFTGATGKSLKGNSTADWNTTAVSIFAVAVPEGTQPSTLGGIFTAAGNFTGDVADNAGFGLLNTSSGAAYALDGAGCITAATTFSTAVPTVVRGMYTSGANGLNGTTWINGVQDATGANCPTGGSTLIEVGGRTAGSTTLDNRIFNGKIGEVVVFRSALTAANANNIESYLALKYGVTLRQTPSAKNYTDSGSAIVWNATTNAAHNQNIAGIGRDDASALNQKQSHSVNTANSGDLVTIGLGTIAADNASNASTFAADRNFMAWGDNGGSTFISIPVPGGGGLWRLPRVWRIDETGTVGATRVRVPSSVLPGTGQVLIRSNDPTFSSGNTQVPLTLTTTNYEGTTDFADGEYFTFAAIPPMSPGGVIGAEYWIRPEEMVVTAGAVSNWDDVYGVHTNEQMLGGGFLYQAAGFNFHPMGTTNGDRYMRFLSQQLMSGATAGEIFSMVEGTSTHTTVGGYPSEFGGGGSATTWQYDYVDSSVLSGWGSTVRKGWNPLTAPAGGPAQDVLDPHIYNVLSKAGEWTARFDGLTNYTTATNAVSFNSSNSSNTYIGAAHNSVFHGRLSEFIVYRRELTAAERQRVNSYYALKYGVTLGTTASPITYLAADGSTFWTGSATYQNAVAGIGRDDNSGLIQRQSTSILPGDIVTIGLGTIAVDNATNPNNFGADKTFMVWGHDGASPLTWMTMTGSGNLRRMPRTWHVQETGTVGSVLVRVPATSLPGTGQVLIVSADPTFDSGDTQVPLVLNGANYQATTDFGNDQYFTFAALPPASPGGVPGETLWLKANAGVTQVTGAASVWADQSGNAKDASQGTAANRPVFQSAPVNFNPGLDFDGSADFMSITGNVGLAGTAPLSFFGAGLRQGTGDWDPFLAQPGGNSNDGIFGWGPGLAVGIGSTIASGTVGGGSLSGTGSYSINVPRLASVTRGEGGANVFNFYADGGAAGSVTNAMIFANDPNTRVSGRVTGADTFNGVMTEVIAYDRTLTAGELQRVHSYLAIKYGITMPQTPALDYVTSDASVVWNATANTTYKNNIAGIGRDDTAAQNQKQSQSVNTANSGNLVTVGLGGIAVDNATNANTFAADKNFLIWGDDGAATTMATAVTGTGLTRMARVWKVQETGTVGSVVVRIPASSLIGSSPVLLRSVGNATFDNTDTQVPLSLVGANYEATVDFASGEFFTFASSLALPGGVAGSSLWLRADSGVNCVANGCTATAWLDQSGNGKHANTPSGTPNWLTNTVDFNPAMHFDANDKLGGASLLGTGTYTNGNVYIVSKKIANGGSDADFYEVNGQGNGQGGLGVIQPWGNDVTYWDAGDNTDGSQRRLFSAAGLLTLGRYELKGYNASTTSGQTFGGLRQAISLNGRVVLSDTTMASYPGVGNPYYVGGYASVAAQSEDIAELVVFTAPINAVQHQSIQSYLAIKYGISIDQTIANSYRASDGTTIPWGAVGNPYKFNITGIGRDDGTALNQRQSRNINTANSGDLVTMGLGSIAADNASNPNAFPANLSFLMWSDDAGSTFTTTPVSGAATGLKRMVRIWRAAETGTVGTVQVRVPASSLPGTNQVLIRSTDTTFDGGDTIVPLVLNGSNYEATTDFANAELFTFAVVPPAAPGGIGGGLAMWLKANAGTNVNGSQNFVNGSGWLDQSGNGRDASIIVSDPQKVANAVNFNPTVRFDRGDYFRFAASPFVTGFTAGEVFSVLKDLSYGVGNDGPPYDFGGGYNSHYTWSNSAIYQDFGSSTRFSWNPITKGIVENKGGTIATVTGPSVDPRLYHIYETRSAPGDWTITFDGATTATTTTNTLNFTLLAGNEQVGSAGNASFFDGDQSEVFLYNRTLTATERQQVTTYLAIKYGITELAPGAGPQNYLSSLGTTIWAGASNGTYHNDVAGIGRDDASALIQRQSASINAGNVLTIGLGTIATDNESNPNNFAADQSFLIWGRDSGALTQTVQIASTNVTRVARIWRGEETGTVGSVLVRVPASALSGTQPMLIRSADATFTSADTFVPMTFTGTAYEATVDFNTGVEFFTFGSTLSTPGGVGGESLWLRADAGMNCVTDNCTATLWSDQSGSGRDATGVTGTLSRKNLGVNFNPILGFDAPDAMRGPSIMGASSITNANIYIVSKKTTIGAASDFYEFNSLAPGNGGLGVHTPFSDSIVYWDAGVANANNRLTAPAGTIVLGQFELKSFNASTTLAQTFAGARQVISKNGKLVTSDATMAAVTGGNKPYQLGGASLDASGGAAVPDGVEDFAEVIVYTTPLTLAQHQAVESYLALKYGITLDQTTARNYIASDGTTLMWTAATNTIYKNNIAGIGRDDTSGLVQRQSKSINSGEFVSIGLGTVALDNVSNPNNFGADKTFMTWGHDNASQIWGTVIAGSPLKRMPRVWRVQETGTVGLVKVQVPKTILGGISPTLFRSVDPTFDNSDTQVPMVVNGAYLEATIDFATGDYFTFASQDGAAIREYGDGYLTDGTRRGAVPGAITPTCYPNQFWEHIPIVQKGVYTNGASPGFINAGLDGTESTFLGDVNNDGKLDWVSVLDAGGANANNGTYVWLGNGDGTFQTAAIRDTGSFTGGPLFPNFAPFGGSAAATESTHLGDVNGDGNVDIVWIWDGGNGNNPNGGTWVWLGNGDGTWQHTPIIDRGHQAGLGFTTAVFGGYSGAESTDVVDVNNDGKLDIVWVWDKGDTNSPNGGIWVWLGNGDGTWSHTVNETHSIQGGTGFVFTPAGGLTPYESTHLVDIDKDGFVDLVWVYDSRNSTLANSGVRWWKGNGNGTFQTTVHQDLGLLGGPGLGTYGAEGGQTGNETTRIVDVNRDGNLDILWIWDAVGDPKLSGTYVYLGNGDGTFNHTPLADVGGWGGMTNVANTIQAGLSASEHTLVGDLNGDGFPDIAWGAEFAGNGTWVWLGKDSDRDGLADIVDTDDDNDGVPDTIDSCQAPGSVGASMQLWLKADQGLTVNASNNAIHWADQTAANRDANLITGTPLKVEAGVNFNPTVTFDGTDYMQFAKSPFVTGFTAGEAFTVLKSNQVAGSTNGNPYDLGAGNASRSSVYVWNDGNIYNNFGTTDRLGWNPVTKAINDAKSGVSAITGPSLDASVYHLYQTHSATNDWGTRFDGIQTATTSSNTVSFTLLAGNEYVGGVGGTPTGFKGDVAEVILYNRTLTATERFEVESYLGTKYGITIGHNYLASDDATVYWDMTANAAYHNDVAGIGRDDTATLFQKQSGSINPGNIVTIGLNTIEATNQLNPSTFAADKTFMMWGHDNGSVGPTFLVPGTDPKLTRLGRVWKVQETLTVGVVTVRVPQSALPGDNVTLIRSTDATFTSADELLPMTAIGTDYEVTIDYANGDFFTFASFLPAPGGVAGPGLWVKANDGPSDTTDGNAVATWSDRSGNAKDLTVLQAAAAVQPLFDSTSLNFNPAVSVLNVGASDQGLWNQNFLGTTNGSYTLDASMFFAHTPHKAANCNGLADFSSPIDGVNSDHPWMGHCVPSPYNGQLAMTWSGTAVQQSGASMTAIDNTPYLHAYTWRYNIASSLSFHENGVVSTDAGFLPPQSGRDFYLLRDNNDNSNDGSDEMNEAIMYPRQLTLGENQRVESYLAIKYGVTLKSPSNGPQDYLNAAATTIWNGVANAVYHNNVAGIMADSASALDQRVSNSVNAGAQIAIASGAFDFATPTIGAQSPTATIGDESSVVWGDNNGTTTINIPVSGSNALAAGLEARMARIWRDEITGTGVPGQVTIRIPSTMVDTGNPTLRNPSLLISTVDTFATDTRVVPFSLIPGYYVATFNTFGATEQYFTIAGATSSVVLSKAFSPTALAIGGTTRLTLTLTNQSPVTQAGLAFVDTLPTGLVVATPANEVTTCAGGSVNATGSTITLSGGSVDASLTCTVAVDVTNSASAATPVTCPAASTTNGSSNITGLATNLSLASGFGACVNLVLSSDVQIVKTAPATFVSGSTVAYTLMVTNNGPSSAAAVTVSDVLSAQLTFVPAGSTPSCSAVAQTVTCNLGTLTSGQVVPITMNVLVAANLPSGTTVNNTASVSTTTPDPDSTNNASVAVSPASTGNADLSIVKSTLEASVTPGGNFTYRLVVTNNGPSIASSVTASDTLPSQVTFVSSPSGCTAAGQVVSCGPAATLAPSTSTTFDVVVKLDPSFVGVATDVSNIASTTSDTTDPNTTNNTSTAVFAPTVLAPSADLVTAKAALEASVTAGETFTYRITVTNNGPSTAVDVGATDTLPTQLAFVSSPEGCTAVGQAVTCGPAASPLLPNTSQTFDIVVRLDPAYTGDGSDIQNTATATSPTPDPTAGNRVSPPAPPPTVTAPKADMQIVKSLNVPAGVVPGTNYDYTLQVQNNGPSFAAGVTVSDPLPPYVVFQSASAGCAFTPATPGPIPGGGTVTCTSAIDPMAVSGSDTFTITVQLDPSYLVANPSGTGAELVNSAIVSATTADPALANNTSPAGAPPVNSAQADIALVKTTSIAPVSPGETFTYNLLVSNQGPSTASDVVVNDTLPAGITYLSGTTGCAAVGQAVTCAVGAPGTLAPAQSVTFVLTVMLDPGFIGSCNDIANIATASSSTADPVPGNNANPAPGACPPLAGNESDVSIIKVASAAPVVPGTDFTYTLTVTNAGPSVATAVAVTDTLPAQLTFVSSLAGCTALGQVVTCPAIPTLALSTPVSYDIVVHLAPGYAGTGADILNTGNVTTTAVDPNLANNTSAASSPTVAAPSADVSATKAILEAAVVPGGTFTYRVVVSNAGPSTASGIVVSDTLPAGVTFVASASCVHAAGTVTCPVGTLAPAASSANVDFVVRLDAAYSGNGSDIGNVATATSATPDPNPANNTNVPVFPNVVAASADVSITKTAVEPSVVPGLTFSYNLVVSNAGPSVATSSVVTDTLPAGLAFVSSSAGCTAVGQDVTCPAISSIAVGGSTTINLVVRLDPAYTGNGSDLGNVATVTPTSADPALANNTSASAPAPTVLAPSADVRVVKNVSGASVAPGETFTYTLTLTNAGPSVSRTVFATDTLPSQVAFVSSPDGCVAAGQSVTCPQVPVLGVGASATFTFVVQLDPSYVGTGANILNSSLVQASTADPALANNSSPAGAPPVGPGQADVAIRKDVSTAPVTPGTNFSYTLTVSNLGPSTATDIVVTDTLPSAGGGVHFISSPDGCTAAAQVVTCPTIGSMVPGGSATFTLVVQLDASYVGNGNDISNTATVTSTTTDPVPANNTSNPATPVVGTASADVSATKTVVEPQALPGENFTYRITVSNAGPSTALGVTIVDALPAQVTFVSSPSGCTAGGQHTVSCPPIGSLAVGTTLTDDIVVTLDSTYTGDGSDVINTVDVTAATPDPNTANNQGTTDIPDVGAGNTDVSITKGVVEASQTPGLPLTYRLTITNAGPAMATGIAVSDTLPAQVTFVSSPSSCTAVGQVVTCPTIATLASGTGVTRDIIVKLDPSYAGNGSDVLNTASAFPTSNDPNLTNNTVTGVPLPSVGPASADLSIAKIVLESSVIPGATFTYRVTATNNGPSTAANVTVADLLPIGLTFVSSASGCTAVAQAVTCTGPALLPTLAQQFEFVVQLDPAYSGTGSDLGNVASVSSTTNDPDFSNNSNAATFPPAIGAGVADLLVGKLALELSVTPGGTFTYAIFVTNNGPSVATDIVISDPLPIGLTFVSSPQGCTAVGQQVTCPAIASLAPTAITSVLVVVRLDPDYTGNGSDLGNVAHAHSPTDPTDPTMPPVPPPAIKPPSADVQMIKSVSDTIIVPGGNFTYTLTVKNNGPSTARNVAVTDTLPLQTAFVSSVEGCTAVGHSVTCPTLATLAVGASSSVTVVVQLDPAYAGTGSDVLNSAIVAATTADPAMANNTAPAGAPPVGPGQADVAIRKDVSTDPVTPGTTFSYLLTVTNQGPSAASNITVSDTLPANLTFVSSTEGCTALGQVVTCPTLAMLNAGASATFTLVVELDGSYAGDGSDIPNVATVDSADTADPIPANNTSNSATPVIGAASSDVSVTKTVLEASVTPGANFTYRIVATNNGPSTALGVQVGDTLPSQVTFVSSPSFCNASGQSVTCPPVGSLAVGATATFDVLVQLNPAYTGNGSDVLNTATVTSTTPDPDPTDNVTPPVAPPPVNAVSADVTMTKTVVESTVRPGDVFTYHLVVANVGPSTATNIAVTDALPGFVVFDSSPSGCTALGVCPTIASLAPGVSQAFDILVRLDPSFAGPGVTVLNQATALVAPGSDPDLVNNTGAVTLASVLAPATAELTLAKQALEPSVTPGLTFTYRITVGNTGPSTATSVVVTDPLPAPLAFVSSVSGCSAVGQLVTCPTVASLLPATTTTFDFVVRLDPAYTGNGSDLGNIAQAHSPTDPTDPVMPPAPPPTVNPPSADVFIIKSVSSGTVTPGTTFSYTLQIGSSGPSWARDVVVTDTLPAHTTFVSSTAGCTAVGQSVTCPTMPTLVSGAALVAFDIVVQLDPSYVGDGSDILNSAIVLATTADPALANNSAPGGAAPVGGPNADLALTKDVSTDPVTPGATFSYHLRVVNQGPSTASNVVVTDPLPAGVTFVSSPEGCTAVGQDVTCPTLPGLGVGGFAEFTLIVQLDQAYTGNGSDIQNVAAVTSPAVDPVPANNTSNPATPVVGTPNANLSIVKSVLETTVSPGGTVTYRLVVSNSGPSTALNVVVTDPLPTQLAFVSSPSFCTAIGQVVTCPPIGSLAVGATRTFDIVAMLDPAYNGPGTDIVNTATSTSSTGDPDTANNTSSFAFSPAMVHLLGADVAVAVAASNLAPLTGDVVTLTITVTNDGPNDATGVVIMAPLPPGTTLESGAPGYNAATGEWIAGNLPIGTPVVLTIQVRIVDRGPSAFTATRTATIEGDIDASNDTATVGLNATGWSTFHSDLVLTGSATPQVAAPGALLTLDLIGVNRGPTYVVDLFIEGLVPTGTTFESVQATPGAVCTAPAAGGTGLVSCKWPGTTLLDIGASRGLRLTVRVAANAAPASSITGDFRVSSLNLEFYEPSNHLTLTTSVADGSVADLAITGIIQSEGATGTALPLPLGVSTPLRFTITNAGPTMVVGARYAIEIPVPDLGMLQIGGASFSQGSVALSGVSSAEWSIGPLAAGASATFDLSVAMTTMQATTIAMRRIESVPGDPNNTNDRATLILDGVGSPDGGERWTAVGQLDGVGLKEIITGAGRLETPQVRIYQGDGTDPGLKFYAYSRAFVGGVRVASCDTDGDGIDELVTAPGVGPGPHVRVFKVQQGAIRETVGFYAYAPDFPGGVYVACADVDHDGRAEIITSPGQGPPEVRVFQVAAGYVVLQASFLAYEPGFTGGVRIAGVQTGEPGGYHIVTVPGPGRPLEIRAWQVAAASAVQVRSLPVTGPEFQLGAFVDVQDINNDGLLDAVIATDVGIPPVMAAFTIDSGALMGFFQPYGTSFFGGARVSLGDLNADGVAEMLISSGFGGRPNVDVYSLGGTASFRFRISPIEIP